MKPFADQALDYLTVGLGYPIPSADPFAKFPPLTGWTGKDGHIPARDQVEIWRTAYPQSNILLRLAKDVVGIDIDNYDDKHGATTIHKAEREHGRLPETFHSSARGDGMSGIYYYRLGGLMDERELKGDLGTDSHVEVIRFSHRYAVVPPSWHQGTATEYKWYPEAPLSKDALPVLPDAWYQHLKHTCGCYYKERKAQREQLARYKQRPLNSQGTMLAQLDFEKNLETLSHLPAGSRNNYLSRVAGRTFLFDCLMNKVLDSAEVYRQLTTAGTDAGLSYDEVTATLHSAQVWAVNMNEEKK